MKEAESKLGLLKAEEKTLNAEMEAGGKQWTATKQKRLETVILELMDTEGRVNELKEAIRKEEDDILQLDGENSVNTTAGLVPDPVLVQTGYVPERGTENLYHVNLSTGDMYDRKTGKQISWPYVQMMNPGNFKTFKENAAALGYRYDVLYEPKK